jgi:uncharacterized membrane protein YgaE (UPF0421/DUF939 family)
MLEFWKLRSASAEHEMALVRAQMAIVPVAKSPDKTYGMLLRDYKLLDMRFRLKSTKQEERAIDQQASIVQALNSSEILAQLETLFAQVPDPPSKQ